MNLVIFDLDGTLIDSKQDLTNAVNATLEWAGLEPIDQALVATYVGNGASILVQRALGPDASQEKVDQALAYFLSYYREHMLDHTRLYPGVREGLDALREAGVRMAVLTNKPVRFSQALIDGLGLHDHFFRVYGGNSFDEKKPSPVGIGRLREETGTPTHRTLMVGDSWVDVKTARNAGVAVAGVNWGLQPESLREEPPDVLVDEMAELTEFVLARASPPK
jgi:phosphoglycolate phosphatase